MMEKIFAPLAILFSVSLCPGHAPAGDIPPCLKTDNASTIESVIDRSGIDEKEVLTRLVFAESISTGYGDEQAVYEAIAWGVMNRVRLGEAFPSQQKIYGRGIRGVIFKKGQFNPAVSKASRFSKEFLCPSHSARWHMAEHAVRAAHGGRENPFIETPWEKQHGISLVVNFYYPQSVQAQAPFAPWEKSRSLRFIGDSMIGGAVLSAQKVRFYRLVDAPRDSKAPGQK